MEAQKKVGYSQWFFSYSDLCILGYEPALFYIKINATTIFYILKIKILSMDIFIIFKNIVKYLSMIF